MASAIGLNGVKVGTKSSQAYLDGKAVKETKALMAELCRQFYSLGWVSGTGGSINIKVHDDSIPKPQQLILMSPSAVQKEKMEPEDMYVLSEYGSVLSAPSPKPYPHKPPKCTDCDPLFMKAQDNKDDLKINLKGILRDKNDVFNSKGGQEDKVKHKAHIIVS